ncbi:hypothetical protein CPB86DRAFT_814676 [Serendipita vermifera]|nr:hypothetical protein CPB86DRAFT_814676 [Serendipita vermifera]
MSLNSSEIQEAATRIDEESLKMERTRVLDQIEHIQRTGEDIRKLLQLWQIYNGIMESLLEIDSKSRCDPILKFPPELLYDIMHQVVTIRRHAKYHIDSRKTLILASVSKRWRHFIFGMPSFWTFLDVNPQHPHYPAKATRSLTLSHDLPLHLSLTMPPRGWEDLLPTLIQNRKRIEEISIHGSPSSYSTCSTDVVTSALSQLFPLPKLIRIYIYPVISDRDGLLVWLLERCKSLQELPLPFFTLKKPMLSFDSFHQLQKVTIFLGLDAFMPLQNTMPMLTDVSLTEYPLDRYHDSSDMRSIETTTDNTSPLKWQSLFCCRPDIQNFPKHVQRMKNLSQLTLTADMGLLRALLSYLDQLTSLQRLLLRLEVFKAEPEITFPLTNARLNSNIKYLTIYAREVGFTVFPSLHRYQTWDSTMISEALLKAMPAIEEVQLNHSYVLGFTQFYDSDSLSNIQRWNLNLSFKEPLQRIYCLPLSTYSIRLQAPPVLWPHFTSPTARILNLAYAPLPLETADIAIPVLEPEKWPALDFLTTYTPHFIKADTDLVHLTQLELNINGKTSPEYSLFGNEDATRLCHGLASNPRRLPSLVALTLKGIPQWDILLLMLKRRNIATAKGISPIRSLRIIKNHPKELTGPVINLMKRKYESLPEFQDISVNETLAKIEDMST